MKTILALLLPGFTSIFAQPDAKEILRRIDQNMISENRVFISKMIIHGRTGEIALYGPNQEEKSG